jgi:molecular chaperone IbpA
MEAANKVSLYQGRTFNLADYVKVEGATFENGLLQIKLVREIPEAMKPRLIPIGVAPDPHIEKKRAA